MLSAFEGNKAETKTMLPVTEKFMAAHQLPDVTVVADAGMIFEANQKAIEAAGLSFILGMKIPDVPCQVAQWRRERPGEDIPDGHIFTQVHRGPHRLVHQEVRPPAATAPSRFAPASTSSPPKTRSRLTSATPSSSSHSPN
jgi:hypothetical protein